MGHSSRNGGVVVGRRTRGKIPGLQDMLYSNIPTSKTPPGGKGWGREAGTVIVKGHTLLHHRRETASPYPGSGEFGPRCKPFLGDGGPK